MSRLVGLGDGVLCGLMGFDTSFCLFDDGLLGFMSTVLMLSFLGLFVG